MLISVHLRSHQLSHLDTQAPSERRSPLHSPLVHIIPKVPLLDHTLRSDVHQEADGKKQNNNNNNRITTNKDTKNETLKQAKRKRKKNSRLYRTVIGELSRDLYYPVHSSTTTSPPVGGNTGTVGGEWSGKPGWYRVEEWRGREDKWIFRGIYPRY